MTKKVKLICYVVLAIAGLWCGINFVRAYSKATATRPTQATADPSQPAQAQPKGVDRSGMMAYAAAFLAVVVCAALLIAFDVSGFFADRFERLVFDEEGEGHRDPEYEEAKKIRWATTRNCTMVIVKQFEPR